MHKFIYLFHHQMGKRISPEVPISYIIILLFDYFFQAGRGLLTFGLKRGSSRLLFRGKGSQIRCRSQVFTGRAVRIGRHTFIDGLGREGVRIEDGAKVGDFSKIICTGSLSELGSYVRIGAHVGLGEFTRIGGSGGVEIGRNTIAGQYLSMHPENHKFLDRTRLIKEQGTERSAISIGENCWIGAKVTVLAGSKVGHSCVIAAGSVVNGEFPPYSVIGGVPAKVLRSY